MHMVSNLTRLVRNNGRTEGYTITVLITV
jgi:hypothetical protein